MPKQLLVADDSLTIRKVIGMVFAVEDVSITFVDNGIDAMTRARELKPDCVLADVLMPGKSGYEVCEALMLDPATASIRVLLLAGNFEPFDEARARAVRADDFIVKPFESQALIDKVRALVGLPAGIPPRHAPTPPSPRRAGALRAAPAGADGGDAGSSAPGRKRLHPGGRAATAPGAPASVPQPMPGPAGMPRPPGAPTPMSSGPTVPRPPTFPGPTAPAPAPRVERVHRRASPAGPPAPSPTSRRHPGRAASPPERSGAAPTAGCLAAHPVQPSRRPSCGPAAASCPGRRAAGTGAAAVAAAAGARVLHAGHHPRHVPAPRGGSPQRERRGDDAGRGPGGRPDASLGTPAGGRRGRGRASRRPQECLPGSHRAHRLGGGAAALAETIIKEYVERTMREREAKA